MSGLDARAAFRIPGFRRATVIPRRTPGVADAHVGLWNPVPVVAALAYAVIVVFAERGGDYFPEFCALALVLRIQIFAFRALHVTLFAFDAHAGIPIPHFIHRALLQLACAPG